MKGILVVILSLALCMGGIEFHKTQVEKARLEGAAEERERCQAREDEAYKGGKLAGETSAREIWEKKAREAADAAYDEGCRICSTEVEKICQAKLDSQSRSHQAQMDSMVRGHKAFVNDLTSAFQTARDSMALFARNAVENAILHRDRYWVDRFNWEFEHRYSPTESQTSEAASLPKIKTAPVVWLIVKSVLLTVAIPVFLNFLRAIFHKHGRLRRKWRL